MVSTMESCCKCKPACRGLCNSIVATPIPTGLDGCDWSFTTSSYRDDINDVLMTMIFVAGGIIVFAGPCYKCLRLAYHDIREGPDRRDVQQRMSERTRRRQLTTSLQQRHIHRQENRYREENHIDIQENRYREENRKNDRYGLFESKFYFQTVLPEKSNITANSLRQLASIRDEEQHDGDNDDAASEVGAKLNSSLSQRLSSWRRPSAKDECCVCLESYVVGETICASKKEQCNHVFHEGCIFEWLNSKDRCPLCRVELLKD